MRNHLCFVRRKKSDRPSRFKNSRYTEDVAGSQPDQALINEWIRTQLDAIGKHFTAIEKCSASAAGPKAKKLLLLGVLLDQVSMGVLLRVMWLKNCRSCIPRYMIDPLWIRLKLESDNY